MSSAEQKGSSAAVKARRFKTYLSNLTPAAARFLINEVELDRLKGGSAFAHDLVLEYARQALRSEGKDLARLGTPLRHFCQPFEELLVDNTTAKKQRGRIARSSIVPVWTWLTETVAPEQMRVVNDRLSEAILEEDEARISEHSATLHAIGAKAIAAALNGVGSNRRLHGHLVSVLGGEQGLGDARDIASILSQAVLTTRIRDFLPRHIESLKAEDIASICDFYREIAARRPDHAYLLPLTAVNRLRRPSDVLKVVAALVGSDRDANVRGTPLEVVGQCLLHDMEVAALGALQAIKDRAPVELTRRFLMRYFELADGVQNQLDIDMKDEWGRRIIAIRNALSSGIKAEVDDGPRRIKSALFRKGRPSEGTSLARPDDERIADAEYAVRLMMAVRPYLSQIPINADFAAARSQIGSLVESVAEITIEDLRRCKGEERDGALAYMDPITTFMQLLFGPDAADLFVRRARVAAQDETSETSEDAAS